MVGIVVEPPVCVAFNATDCGKIGLHGECELTDALDDVSGTPDVEYKSWLNWNETKNVQIRVKSAKVFCGFVFLSSDWCTKPNKRM